MKAALQTDDQQALGNSLQNLKRAFRFIAILAVIVLLIFVLTLAARLINYFAGPGL